LFNVPAKWLRGSRADSHYPLTTLSERFPTEGREQLLATRRYLQYAILPIWFIAGVADYFCHRRSKVETTSGMTESLIHSVMIAEGGIPVIAGLHLAVNSGVLGLSLVAFAAHQA
jgi:hypothetical protein